jgi:hypothetical protein
VFEVPITCSATTPRDPKRRLDAGEHEPIGTSADEVNTFSSRPTESAGVMDRAVQAVQHTKARQTSGVSRSALDARPLERRSITTRLVALSLPPGSQVATQPLPMERRAMLVG